MKEEINKEKAILQAAEEEFITKGFAATKTVEIAKKAGVTHAMLHYYFRTKEKLFNCVYEEKIELLKQSVQVFFTETSLPFAERIKLGIESHFDFLRANPRLPMFVINEIMSNPERLSLVEKTIGEIAINILATLQGQIDKAVKEGEIVPVKASDLIIDIVSLNIFVFTIFPLAKFALIPQYDSEEDFFNSRKRENVRMIMCRLKNND